VLADEVGREALHCIRCSACLNVCPVYERTGGHAYGSVYPGPIGAILSPQLTGLTGDSVNDTLPYASSLCGACYDVCPVKIDIPSILVDLRARHVEARADSSKVPSAEAVAMSAASYAMSHPAVWSLAQKASRAGRVLGRRSDGPDRRISALPPPLGAWTAAATCRCRRSRRSASGGPRSTSEPANRRPYRGARADRAAIAKSPTDPAVTRAYRTRGEHEPGSAALVDLLEDRLLDYKAGVHRTTADQIDTAVRAALDRHVPDRAHRRPARSAR
jgi:ferredoxin